MKEVLVCENCWKEFEATVGETESRFCDSECSYEFHVLNQD